MALYPPKILNLLWGFDYRWSRIHILFNNAKSNDIIQAYKTLISKAHLSNKFIFGATILPFGKNSNYNEERDKVRNEVNEWIKNSGKDKESFDDYFDFDEFTRDPNGRKSLDLECESGDGLHPSPQGYKRIAEFISNLLLFNLDLLLMKKMMILLKLWIKLE